MNTLYLNRITYIRNLVKEKNIIKSLVICILLLISLSSYANLPGYDFYKVLTIQSTQVSGTGIHSNFPVLINHTDPDLRTIANGGNVVNTNGYDIQFSAANGTTVLEHDLEYYNPLTGEVTAWVKLPSLSTSINTDLRIYYGNSSIFSNQSVNTVWDTNYKGIFHLDDPLEDGSTISDDFDTNLGVTPYPSSIVAGGANFNPVNPDYLRANINPEHQILGDLTLEAWVNIDNLLVNNFDNIIVSCAEIGTSFVENIPYYFHINSNGTLGMYWEYQNGATPNTPLITESSVSASLGTNNWNHVAVTRNAATNQLYFYKNGVQLGTAISYSDNPSGGSVTNLVIGSHPNQTLYNSDFKLDEVRISNKVRSSDWILTNFNSMNSPSIFYTTGSQQIVCIGPNISSCPSDINVNANASCEYTLLDYISSITAIDVCSTGSLVYSQNPVAGTVLNAGVNLITMTVTDGVGNTDDCTFEITVLANLNPTVVSCGQTLTNESTTTESNTVTNFTCASGATAGNDKFYQMTVPSGNYWMQISMANAFDDTNSEANVFWIGNTCPLGSTCDEAETFNLSTNTFSNGTNSLKFLATGPATYFFVVDSDNGDIDTYDITFDCLESGIEFDENCAGDLNSDGAIIEINNSPVLDVIACENVKICSNINVSNPINLEWLDSVKITLGDCYTNISTLTPDNGTTSFHNTNGTWDGTYLSGDNSIVWMFNDPINQFGDGLGSIPSYSCGQSTGLNYDFCFNADITAGCTGATDLDIIITIVDAGIGGSGGTAPSTDVVLIDNINLDVPIASFNYSTTNYCKDELNETPTITGDLGGSFTASPTGLSINASTGEIDYNLSGANTYEITYSTNNICPITETFNLVVNPLPTFNISTQTNPTTCLGTDGTITISGLTDGIAYKLEYFDGNSNIINIVSSGGIYILSSLQAGIYNSFSILNFSTGCTSEAISTSITLTDPIPPIINAGVDITICDNIDTMLTANNPNGASISWNNGITDGTLFSPSIGTTNYVITATLLGCVSTDDVDVTVNPLPSVNAGLDITICDDIDTLLTATNPDGAAIIWDNGITDGTLFPSTVGTTIYEVTATLLGCISKDITVVTVNPLPNINAGIDIVICENLDTMLTAINPDGATISWSSGITDGILFTQSVGTITYEVTANLLGCISKDYTDITVNVLPIIFGGGDITICENIDTMLTAFNPNGATIFWDNGITDGTLFSQTVGLTTYEVTANILGCISTDNVDVTVNPLPNVDAGTDIIICDNVDTMLTAINPDAATISWNNSITDATLFSQSVGTITYEVTATLLGCVSTDITDITVKPLPIVNAGIDITICDNLDTMFTAINPDGALITWNNGIADGTLFSPVVGSTAYVVTATLLGCESTDTTDLIVKPLPNINAGPDISVCEGIDTMLITINPDGALLYWDNGIIDGVLFSQVVGTTTYEVTATLLSCVSTDNVDVTIKPLPKVNAGIDINVCENIDTLLTAINPDGAQISWNNDISNGILFTPSIGYSNFTVTAILNGCSNTDNITVFVKLIEDVGFTYSKDEFCTNEGEISPEISASGGVFSINNNLTIDTNSGLIDLTNASQNQYEINYFKDDYLCPIDSNVTIFIYEEVFANAGVDQLLDYKFETELSANAIPFGTGTWEVLNGPSQIDDVNYINSNVNTLKYGDNVFSWSIQNGTCPLSIDIIIVHIKELVIPQAITPNNDGKNDIFLLKGIENKKNKIQIFNSWGELIFISTNNDSYWNGTDTKGKELINDTYFYIIEIENEPIYKGFVVLKK